MRQDKTTKSAMLHYDDYDENCHPAEKGAIARNKYGQLVYENIKLHPYRLFGADTGLGVYGRPWSGHWLSHPGKAIARLLFWNEDRQVRGHRLNLKWLVGPPCKRCNKDVDCFCAEKAFYGAADARKTGRERNGRCVAHGRCAPGGCWPASDGCCGPSVSARCCVPPRNRRQRRCVCVNVPCCRPNGCWDPAEFCRFYPAQDSSVIRRARGCCGFWPVPMNVKELLEAPEKFGLRGSRPVPHYVAMNLAKATERNDDFARSIATEMLRKVFGSTPDGMIEDAAAFTDPETKSITLAVRFPNGRERHFLLHDPHPLTLDRKLSARAMRGYDLRLDAELSDIPQAARLYMRGQAHTVTDSDWQPWLQQEEQGEVQQQHPNEDAAEEEADD